MKAGAVAVQGALALGGLLLAYATWQREPEAPPESVVVLDASKNDVQKVRYESDGKYFELTRDVSGSEPVVWLQQGPRDIPAIDSPDGGVALPPSHPPLKLTERLLKGNEMAQKTFERFAPLRGARSLGAVQGDKLKELGLEKPTKRLIVTTRGGEQVFWLGQPVAGMGQPYLRNEKDGRVYLLQGSTLMDLEAADSRLVDRKLHDFALADIDGMTVKTTSKQRDLVKDKGSPPTAPKWAAKTSPDKPDDFIKNWHEKIWRITSVEVLGKGEIPAGGEPTIKLHVAYTWKGEQKGFLELAQSSSGETFARTEHTAGWVKVHGGAADLIKEADKVVAGS